MKKRRPQGWPKSRYTTLRTGAPPLVQTPGEGGRGRGVPFSEGKGEECETRNCIIFKRERLASQALLARLLGAPGHGAPGQASARPPRMRPLPSPSRGRTDKTVNPNTWRQDSANEHLGGLSVRLAIRTLRGVKRSDWPSEHLSTIGHPNT